MNFHLCYTITEAGGGCQTIIYFSTDAEETPKQKPYGAWKGKGRFAIQMLKKHPSKNPLRGLIGDATVFLHRCRPYEAWGLCSDALL